MKSEFVGGLLILKERKDIVLSRKDMSLTRSHETRTRLWTKNNATSKDKSSFITKMPFYYGWVIVLAAIIGRIMTSPGQTYTVSIFIEHFIQDLGISRSVVSSLYTFGTLAASLALPFIGRQIDKRGPRVMVGAITFFFALACLYMSQVRNIVMLGFGFVLIRLLGQGSLSMVSGNVVNRWWVRRRGLTLGIVGVMASLLGSGLFPSLVNSLIQHFGWRVSYALLGLAVAIIMLPVGLGLFRRQPEDYGLLPDGQAVASNQPDGAEIEENWTVQEALRTPSFWIIGLGLASIGMLSTGLQFHMVSILGDAGLPVDVAASAFMPIAMTNAVVMLSSGALGDRIPIRFLLFGALLAQAAALIMAPRLTSNASALAYGVVLGIAGGLEGIVALSVWATYYGRRHLGSITGIASLVMIAGSALGPMPMGIARDLLGSYDLALTLFAALPLVLGVVVLFSRRPRRRTVAA